MTLFRGGLVLEAHKRVYHSTLGSRAFQILLRESSSSYTNIRNTLIFVYSYAWCYMTLGRCPLSIFCSRGTPPRISE